jgi:hypothetical protein
MSDAQKSAEALVLKSQNPDWGYIKIAKEIDWDKNKVRRAIEKAGLNDTLVRAGRAVAVMEIEPRTAEEFAERINACWRESAAGIIRTGEWLIRAKAALPHGEFGPMIEAHLTFSASTAERLMAIACDPRLTNPAHAQLLPPAWTTLYELTKLDDEQFQAQLEQGKIRPDMERREAIKGARSIMGSRAEPDDSLDFFPTPPWATRALFEHPLRHLGIYVGETLTANAWEPACGEGHMSAVLEEYCAPVIATDIFDYSGGNRACWPAGWFRAQDFLDDRAETPVVDWIITNPPFGAKTEAFVLRALDLACSGVAIFARLQWLETIGRYERLFRDMPPTQIAFFCERVNLCKGRWEPDGGTATAYIWLVWVKGEPPRAPFWIPPGCRESLSKADDRERFAGRV